MSRPATLVNRWFHWAQRVVHMVEVRRFHVRSPDATKFALDSRQSQLLVRPAMLSTDWTEVRAVSLCSEGLKDSLYGVEALLSKDRLYVRIGLIIPET